MEMESGTMNVHQILVTAVIAVLFLYLVLTFVFPLFNSAPDLDKAVNPLLNNAQATLGKSETLSTQLKKGQTILAKNFNSPLRSVAFACNSPDCCSYIENCRSPLIVTPERIIINQSIKSQLTARCEPTVGLHACKVYVGNTPAQLEWHSLQIPFALDLTQGTIIETKGNLLNSGETDSGNITLEMRIIEERLQEGKLQQVEVVKTTQEITSLPAGKNTSISLTAEIKNPGTYTIMVRATAFDGGSAEKKDAITVSGEIQSECRTTISQPQGILDTDTGMCRRKKFCEGCTFAFECRQAWIDKGGITGAIFDTNRGENTFTYTLYRPNAEGVCR